MASKTRPVSTFSKRGRFHRYRKKMTPKNDAAFSRNATPDPAMAITIPPSAGPTARATLNPTEFNATAGACCAGETISGVMACHAGSFITAPRPSTNVNPSRIQGVTFPNSVKMPSSAAAATIQPWVISRKRRRSTMSASAPAGKMTRKTGSVVAACTRPTMNGDIVSWVISQPEPTFCIQVPVYEITAATQSERKRGSPNGAQAEPFAVLGNIGVLTMSAMLVACNLGCGCVLSKRPLPVTPGAQEINDYAANQDQKGIANLGERVRSRNQYEHKSNRCGQRG